MQPYDPSTMQWALEGVREAGGQPFRIPVRPLPFPIGRQADAGLSLRAPSVSGLHAELFESGGRLWIRDLGSTNGSFVNRERIDTPRLLEDGDLLHFAEQGFLLVAEGPLAAISTPGTLQLRDVDLPRDPRLLRTLIDEGCLACGYQPIVRLDGAVAVGFEALGHGTLEGLPSQPAALFTAAASVGLECELSRALRMAAASGARGVEGSLPIFVNTHPAELEDPERLVESMAALVEGDHVPRLVLEIHEAAITETRVMGELKAALADLDVALAYDDFGAGQARLVELLNVRPDYLKFDMALIHNLDRFPPSTRKAVAGLVRVAQDLGIEGTVAEGIERESEAEACLEAGFTLAQGYHFGRPRPGDELPRDKGAGE